MIRGSGVMRDMISGGTDVECVLCDVECYVKHGSGMWNWV